MPDIKTWKIDQPFLALKGALLEGPAYDEASDQLRWVDIIKCQVSFLKVSEGAQSLRTFTLENETLGTLWNIQGEKDLLFAGAKYGLATFNTVTGRLDYFHKYYESKETGHRFRSNDGAIDARGRIFQGVLVDDQVDRPCPDGKLTCMDLDGTLRTVVDKVTCPNGLGWNSTNTIMYWAESASGNLYAFDYDLETGTASNQRVFFHLEPGSREEHNTNVPDGLAIDVEDHIWLAVWGSSQVLRISPEGEVVGRIEVPTRFVTCPAFVGTDLYITTAAERDSERHPESAKEGGNLFRCEVGVRGLERFACRAVWRK
ncbi:Ca2+-binding protein Regucalcin [Pseudocercospora fijiensis CIRAD86]|uniref:Ca2+-binding protein Regucalcin n=1 Tax=Pseudocercospora fijiensis (strain CIRAD86) TaxID=383855 RepID=M3B2M5_PSEFD|nr:Ca2+-binding protein Regucalcin [Pseudocercospora fijiensis CIRAD86]EME83618.1 Ca2+-binding protein Regucalcin [Pseudocercospora fijiensis CIRAD86]